MKLIWLPAVIQPSLTPGARTLGGSQISLPLAETSPVSMMLSCLTIPGVVSTAADQRAGDDGDGSLHVNNEDKSSQLIAAKQWYK